MATIYRAGGVRIVGPIHQTISIEMSFDGGCRTPVVAGAGCEIVINKGTRMYPVEEPIEERIQIREYPMGGGHTSNKMEYEGLLIGLRVVCEHVRNTRFKCPNYNCTVKLTVKGDSELVINQMNGSYEARDMKHMNERATNLLSEIEDEVDSLLVTFRHIPREQNTAADGLANEAMDEKRSWYTVYSNCDKYHLYGRS